MNDHHSIISAGGRVVIPSDIRKKLGLNVGEEVIFKLEEDGVKLISLKESVKKIRLLSEKYKTSEKSLVNELLAARRDEANND